MSDDIDRSKWSEEDHNAESFGQDLVEIATGKQPERAPDPTPDQSSNRTGGLGAWLREQPGVFGFIGLALLLLILVAFTAFVMSVLGGSDEDSHSGTDAASVYSGDEPDDSAVVEWNEDSAAADDGQESVVPSDDQDAPTSSSTPSTRSAVPVPDDFPVPIVPGGKVVEFNDDDRGLWAIAEYPLDRFDHLVDFYAKWLEDKGCTVNREDQGSDDYPAVWLSASDCPEGEESLLIAVLPDKLDGDVTVTMQPGGSIKESS